MASIDERLAEVERLIDRMGTDLLSLTGRISMLTQQVRNMTDTVLRGFTRMTATDVALEDRLSELERLVDRIEGRKEP